jgi:hypothetical protein
VIIAKRHDLLNASRKCENRQTTVLTD